MKGQSRAWSYSPLGVGRKLEHAAGTSAPWLWRLPSNVSRCRKFQPIRHQCGGVIHRRFCSPSRRVRGAGSRSHARTRAMNCTPSTRQTGGEATRDRHPTPLVWWAAVAGSPETYRDINVKTGGGCYDSSAPESTQPLWGSAPDAAGSYSCPGMLHLHDGSSRRTKGGGPTG